MTLPKLTGLCGSLRRGSHNRLLLAQAQALFGPADYTDGNLDLPLYNGDNEDADGIPPDVQRLSDQIKFADAIIVVTPEYNQSLSGVLKNALDWVSRTEGGPWKGKPVAILSAAAGRSGGARAQYALRLCLAPFRPNLIPGPEVLVAGASKEFGDNGQLINPSYIKALTEHMAMLRDATNP